MLAFLLVFALAPALALGLALDLVVVLLLALVVVVVLLLLVVVRPPSLMWQARFSRKPYSKLAISGGMSATLLATRLCAGRVRVFGMETREAHDCCANASLNYKYHEPEETKHKCCARERETRDEGTLAAYLKRRHARLMPRVTYVE